jgi:hypothetical protein
MAEDEPEGGAPDQESWPRHQVYFVTVEWLDAVHRPESPERLAQLLRHSIEHAHDHGPGMAAARFTVRVKSGEVAAEVTGLATHRHHGQAPEPPSL